MQKSISLSLKSQTGNSPTGEQRICPATLEEKKHGRHGKNSQYLVKHKNNIFKCQVNKHNNRLSKPLKHVA